MLGFRCRLADMPHTAHWHVVYAAYEDTCIIMTEQFCLFAAHDSYAASTKTILIIRSGYHYHLGYQSSWRECEYHQSCGMHVLVGARISAGYEHDSDSSEH